MMHRKLSLGISLTLALSLACNATCLLGASLRYATAPRAANDNSTLIDLIQPRLVEEILAESNTSEAQIEEWRAQLTPEGYWNDIDYADQSRTDWQPIKHIERLYSLAKAYHTPENVHYQSNAITSAVRRGLAYYYTADPVSDNWWYNDIGEGKALGRLLLVFEQQLSADLRQRGADRMIEDTGNRTGQNLVWLSSIIMYRGCIEKNETYVRQAFDNIRSTLVVSGEEGIQSDFSFHQHGAQLYSGGYGYAYVRDLAYWIKLGYGTAVAFSQDDVTLYSRLLLDGHRWMVRHQTLDYSTIGRDFTRQRVSQRGGGLAKPARTMASLNVARKAEFEALANHIKNDRPAPLSGNRHFWRSDYMAHHRSDFFASVKMCSERTIGTEMVNQEGLKSYYVPFGATYIYPNKNAYDEVFPVWDWQKIPGTTTRQTAVLPTMPGEVVGTTAFVGGVSNGTDGLAVLDYDYHGVRGKKSWFFFGQEIICLGAGLTAEANDPVFTTLNQSLASGPVVYQNQRNVKSLSSRTTTASDARWVLHDQVGYVFLEKPPAVTIKRDQQTGSWRSINRTYDDTPVRKDVFSLWIDHGRQISNEKYAYAILPQVSQENLTQYSRQRPLEIINRDDLQLVHHRQQQTIGIAFYAAGEVTLSSGLRWQANRPCVVLIKHTEAGPQVSVANPTNTALNVSLVVNTELVGNGAQWNPATQESTLSFTLPGGLTAGKSVTRQFTPGTPPTVSLTAPEADATFAAEKTVTLTATASDADGRIEKVAFYRNQQLLHESAAAPYTYDWLPDEPGQYALTAVATDDTGNQTTSSEVQITVTEAAPPVPENQVPTVQFISPSENTVLTLGDSLEVRASASDADGRVVRIVFSVNRQVTATHETDSFAFFWQPSAVGDYTWEAYAEDESGARSTTAVVRVQVVEPPAPAPAPSDSVSTPPITDPLPTPAPPDTEPVDSLPPPPPVAAPMPTETELPPVSNTLTPNGDYRNDTWRIDTPASVTCDVWVYDRGGRVVFQQRNYQNTWSGTSQGRPLADGVYYYRVRWADTQQSSAGYITLLRP